MTITRRNYFLKVSIYLLKVNESRYIALFVVSGSMKKYPVENCEVTPHCLYRDSLTLMFFTNPGIFLKNGDFQKH